MMTIEKITEINEFNKLEPVWDGILQKSQNNLLFLSFDFIKTEWENIGWELEEGKKLRPFVVVVKENDEILGLFPFVKERKQLYGMPVTMIRSLGHTYLDRSDVIITDKPRAAVEKMFQYFEESDTSWNLLLMQNIIRNSPFTSIAADLHKKNKFKLGVKHGYQSPYVEKNMPWPEYVKSRPRSVQKVIKNKTNRLERNVGKITTCVYNTPAEVESALQTAFDIDSRSWKSLEGTAISSTERSRQYWKSLTSYLTVKGQVKIWILWVDDKAIAFEYNVLHDKKVYSLKKSYDKEYQRYSPGLLLKYKVMESIWQEDVVEIDLLGISDISKEQWTNKKRKHNNVYIFNNTLYSRIGYLFIFRLLNAAAKLTFLRRVYAKLSSWWKKRHKAYM